MLKTRSLSVVALAALLLPAALMAQQTPQAASAVPAEPSASAQTSPEKLDAATAEILSSIHGYGPQLKAPVLNSSRGRYRLEIGDTVNLNFLAVQQYNETVNVRTDGYISLIGLPDLRVEGETEPELLDNLKTAYAKVLSQPILVSITVQNFEKPYFVVGGQVNTPGKYVLKGATTLTESIAIAGGFSSIGWENRKRVLLFRRTSSDQVEARVFNLKKILDKGVISEDVALQPGDFVFVPKNFLHKAEPYFTYFLAYNIFNVNFVGGSQVLH